MHFRAKDVTIAGTKKVVNDDVDLPDDTCSSREKKRGGGGATLPSETVRTQLIRCVLVNKYVSQEWRADDYLRQDLLDRGSEDHPRTRKMCKDVLATY